MNDDNRFGGFVRNPGDAEPLPGAGGHLLLGGAESGGRLAVVLSEAPGRDEVPPHVHHDADECFVVLDGVYTVTCGNETFDAGPESLVYLPRGVPHSYRLGAEGGRMLVLGVPAGLEDFFRDMGDGVDHDTLQARHRISFVS